MPEIELELPKRPFRRIFVEGGNFGLLSGIFYSLIGVFLLHCRCLLIEVQLFAYEIEICIVDINTQLFLFKAAQRSGSLLSPAFVVLSSPLSLSDLVRFLRQFRDKCIEDWTFLS